MERSRSRSRLGKQSLTSRSRGIVGRSRRASVVNSLTINLHRVYTCSEYIIQSHTQDLSVPDDLNDIAQYKLFRSSRSQQHCLNNYIKLL